MNNQIKRGQLTGSKESVRNNLELLNHQFAQKDFVDILRWCADEFGNKIVLGTAFGASGMVLIHKIASMNLPIRIFTLDTGLLFEETYTLWKNLEKEYGIEIETVSPILTLEGQKNLYHQNLWEKNPDQCCIIRKVLPLKNYLINKEGWITGLRRSQAKSRKDISIVEWDSFNKVIKINPLADWSLEKVWNYIHEHSLSYNPLHDEGYPSIGCFPCTSKAISLDDERSGRWVNLKKTECGIHNRSQRRTDQHD